MSEPNTSVPLNERRSMRVVFCWPCPSGYMMACFRELAARKNVSLAILGFQSPAIANFEHSPIESAEIYLMQQPQELHNYPFIESWVVQQKPDVVVLPGWGHKPYRKLRNSSKLASCRFVLGIDSPGHSLLRKSLVRVVLRRYLRGMDRVMVAGERAFQYARFLGVPEGRIRRGLYACDFDGFSRARDRRLHLHPAGWPRQFLYVGRYVPVKGISLLIDAYHQYRQRVADPWTLTCCGRGPCGERMTGMPGVHDKGFVQPADLPEVLADHGAFVLPSLYEPWGVAIAEACAAGMPIICSEACGAAVENVRHYHNGLVIPTGDLPSLVEAMVWIHHHPDRMSLWGERSQQLAAAYSAQMWADRWEACFHELGAQ